MTTQNTSIDNLLSQIRSKMGSAPIRDQSQSNAILSLEAYVEDYAEYALLQRIHSLYHRDSALRNPYFQPRSGTVSSVLQIENKDYVTFSNYNYLGLSNDARVKAAACEAIETYGTHAGAARMVGGEIELHRELEQALAEFTGFEATAVAVGGYSTNVSAIGYLLDKRDLIIHDEYMHNSGVMGAVMSGAKRIAFPHNNMDALKRLLEDNRSQHRKTVILVEGAYSMDGDLINLPAVVELKNQFNDLFMVLAADIGGKPQITIMISEDLISKHNLNAGSMIRELAKEIKGGGGGQPFYATAGGKDLGGLGAVVTKARQMMPDLLKS